MQLLARAWMKNVASWDKQCELQNSVNHWIFEGKLGSLDIQGTCLSEGHVRPTPFGVAKELQTFDDTWLSMYLNWNAIVKVVFGRLN